MKSWLVIGCSFWLIGGFIWEGFKAGDPNEMD